MDKRIALGSAGPLIVGVALSGPSDPNAIARGACRLAAFCRVSVDPRAFELSGLFAGSDDDRAMSLLDALGDPAVRAVVCVRGGYGATRVLARHGGAIAALLARDPKPIVGFSDVTALHALWARAGARSIHGPMLARLGTEGAIDDETLSRLARVLLDGEGDRWTGLDPWVDGETEGVARGGNLAVLAALCGTPWAPRMDGAVLFLEDVGERPYRVDRMLTQLRSSGALDGIRGVVLGEWTDCEPGPDGVTVEQVLRERLCDLGVPVLANAPFGHGARCRPFALHGTVRIARGGVLAFGSDGGPC
jgi:muramoyltetrapeptide carboxypeptidase